MRDIRIHDTRSGQLQALAPADPAAVGIYACGPTVYSRIHIGNARPFVIFSLLKRFLEHEGYGVQLVINVTDVNDKIYDAARAQGRASAELAAEMTELYRADTDALGLGRPDHEPLASETIGPIVEHIDALVRARPRLRGRRRRLLPRALRRGLRQPLAPPPRRHGPGRGRRGRSAQGGPARLRAVEGRTRRARTPCGTRPGGRAGRAGTSSARRWPSSCSGVGFDMHGGGSDLVFPHHENEAAQTRAARGAELTQAVDAQRHDPVHRREDGQVRRQHRAAARGDRRVRRRGGGHVPDLRPLPPAACLLAVGAG